MPLYEYFCKACKAKFESFSSRSIPAADDQGCECETCGKDAKRVEVSTTGNPVFKGTGFYETDYKKKKKLNSEE